MLVDISGTLFSHSSRLCSPVAITGIRSLWEVRDRSASRFAEEFYRALLSGIPLRHAMKQARKAIQDEPGDPTWLAYTLYGTPTAVLLKESNTESVQ